MLECHDKFLKSFLRNQLIYVCLQNQHSSFVQIILIYNEYNNLKTSFNQNNPYREKNTEERVKKISQEIVMQLWMVPRTSTMLCLSRLSRSCFQGWFYSLLFHRMSPTWTSVGREPSTSLSRSRRVSFRRSVSARHWTVCTAKGSSFPSLPAEIWKKFAVLHIFAACSLHFVSLLTSSQPL